MASAFIFACSSSHLSKKERIAIESNPPGTVKLTDTLYIDRTEVANVHWREFLFYQQRTFSYESKELMSALLDTLVWTEIENPTELPDIYFRHPSFNNSPAVVMSYEQALAFCEWRTNAVNFLLSKKPNGKFKKVKYRLPTNAEWELAAQDGLDLTAYPFGLKSVYDNKNMLLIHCYQPAKIKEPHFYNVEIYTTPIHSFQPNNKGIYQIQGNVSAMIAEKAIAKGRNFILPLDSCQVKQNHPYTKPEAWLGFRCVCEIIE